MKPPAYVIVTPVRNEVAHIQKTIESVMMQTLRPKRWVIMDDGSNDGTTELIRKCIEGQDWISTVRRGDRGWRSPGDGVVQVFLEGHELVKDQWDFLVKLDGDLSFDENYFHDCISEFTGDERLGIGGGTVCVVEQSVLRVDSKSDPPFHVRGATKIYRRECWLDIQPLLERSGWDTMDEVKAQMKGWSTRTFRHVRVIQHKATGAADGSWKNWYKNGRGCYNSGYDPVFMLIKCVKRAFASPPVVPALALAAGFCVGYATGAPQYEDREVIRFLRRQQRRRLILQSSIYASVPAANSASE